MDSPPTPDWITSTTRTLQHNPELQLAARHELTLRAAFNAGP